MRWLLVASIQTLVMLPRLSLLGFFGGGKFSFASHYIKFGGHRGARFMRSTRNPKILAHFLTSQNLGKAAQPPALERRSGGLCFIPMMLLSSRKTFVFRLLLGSHDDGGDAFA